MKIDYVKGSRGEFLKFVDSIGLYDKIVILTHVDLDGLSSGLFLEEILSQKGIKVDYLDFLDIKPDLVKEVSIKLEEKRITKIFFCDLNVEKIDFEGFKELKRDKDVFLIDHHPVEEKLKDEKNIIKTDSRDCTAMTIFDLGREFIDIGAWEWLVCATMFSDYSFISEKNFLYMKLVYPEVGLEDLSSSVPGINARKISCALIYYKNDVGYVYNLVKERKIDELSEVYRIVEGEIEEIVEDFSKNNEYYSKNNLCFYEIKSSFDVLSYVASLVSKMNEVRNFLFMFRDGDHIKFSARSTKGVMDMGRFMSRAVAGLDGASGGGHKAAAAAKIRSEDLGEFKRRLLIE